MIEEGPEGARTLAEVAEDLEIPQHVLRFWETRFPEIRPVKRAGGRRLYRPEDVALLKGIRRLLYGEGYTIRSAQRVLKERGVAAVCRLGEVADAPVRARDGAVAAAPPPAERSAPRPGPAADAGPAPPDAPAAPAAPAGAQTDRALQGEIEALLDELLALKRLLDESR